MGGGGGPTGIGMLPQKRPSEDDLENMPNILDDDDDSSLFSLTSNDKTKQRDHNQMAARNQIRSGEVSVDELVLAVSDDESMISGMSGVSNQSNSLFKVPQSPVNFNPQMKEDDLRHSLSRRPGLPFPPDPRTLPNPDDALRNEPPKTAEPKRAITTGLPLGPGRILSGKLLPKKKEPPQPNRNQAMAMRNQGNMFQQQWQAGMNNNMTGKARIFGSFLLPREFPGYLQGLKKS